jgi:hypothetical protein
MGKLKLAIKIAEIFVNSLVDDYFVLDRTGAVRILTDRFIDRFQSDSYFSHTVAFEGHRGYDNYDDADLLHEIEDFGLVDRALELGIIDTESAL